MTKHFEYWEVEGEGWHFRFVHSNGKEIFRNDPSDPYASKQKCIQGINAARECDDAPVEKVEKKGAPLE